LTNINEALPLIGIYTHPLSVLENGEKNSKTNLKQRLESWERYASNLKRLRERFYYPLLLFDPIAPDLFFDTIFQLFIELGRNPDIKHISGFKKKLPRDKIYGEKITCSSSTLFQYLEEHTYKINTDSFAYQLLKLKKNFRFCP